MTPEVEMAVEEIRGTFEGNRIEVDPEEQGGAYVIVHGLHLSPIYAPALTWCGFLITFQYPRADVYPHFVVPELKRADGNPLGTGFSGPTVWRERQAIQVSRRSNNLNPAVDTAAGKLLKVIEWMRAR